MLTIHTADLLIPGGGRSPLPGGAVLVEGRRIAAVEVYEDLAAAHPTARVRRWPGVLTPGLVNTHHHLYQTLTRARAQEATLFEWLRKLYPVWAQIDRRPVAFERGQSPARKPISRLAAARSHLGGELFANLGGQHVGAGDLRW